MSSVIDLLTTMAANSIILLPLAIIALLVWFLLREFDQNNQKKGG